MVIKFVVCGELHAPIIGKIFGCEKIRSLGNSSLKSLDTRAVYSLLANILATISFRCHLPRHAVPDGVIASFVCSSKSSTLIPLNRDSVASLDRVFSPNQL